MKTNYVEDNLPVYPSTSPIGSSDLRLFDKIVAEREANNRLKRENPAAYESKMRAGRFGGTDRWTMTEDTDGV